MREIEREVNIVYLTQRGDGVTEKERMNISLYKKTKERERERNESLDVSIERPPPRRRKSHLETK